MLPPSGEQVLIDVGFKDSLQLARPTPPYQRLLDVLPVDFVGTAEVLKQVLHLVCAASAEAFAAHDMVVPPWRTYSGMLLRWTSSTYTELSPKMLPLPARKQLQRKSPKVAAGMHLQQLQHRAHGPCGDQQQGPRNIVVGFPWDSADAQGPASVQFPVCRAQQPPTMKYVSQQIDRLLGPMRKVKLGCV
jgi:hypothetical protein